MKRNNLRNIGIIAHVDAGKTTVTERILYYTGECHHYGDVHTGNTQTDFTREEREHGITIFSAATSVNWREHKLNIIDTPGHIDFNIEVSRSLRVLDGAVVIFDGVAGVEPQSESNWHLADKYQIPRICFINKLDRVGANYLRVVEMIKNQLDVEPLPVQLPIGEEHEFKGVIDLIAMKSLVWQGEGIDAPVIESDIPEPMRAIADQYRQRLVETVIEQDDLALSRYLDGEDLDAELLKACIRKGSLAGDFVAVLCGSAYKNKGVQPLLDAILDYLPSPFDRASVLASYSDEIVEVKPQQDGLFIALVFKIVNDKHGSLTFLRVYSGQCSSGDTLFNSSSGKRERIGRIFEMHAAKKRELSAFAVGDIVAVLGLKHSKTGDTLCSASRPLVLERISVAEPVIGMAIEAKRKQDHEALVHVLHSFVQEDPSLQLKQDAESGQLILAGQGELHLAMRIERLLTENHIEVQVGKPHVSYRETISEHVEVSYLHKKQSGGPGQRAEVTLQLEPLTRGEGIVFESKIVGGLIPLEYIPSVEAGIRNVANAGIVAGYPLVDFKATLIGGSYHEQDSSTRAFEIAAAACFKQAALSARPKLLEPIMAVEVSTPIEFLGDCIGDISARRGAIVKQTQLGGKTELHARVPLAKMFGYIGDLRAMSSGRAAFSMQFDHYGIVPDNIAKQVIAS